MLKPHTVAQASLEVMVILLPQPIKCRIYRSSDCNPETFQCFSVLQTTTHRDETLASRLVTAAGGRLRTKPGNSQGSRQVSCGSLARPQASADLTGKPSKTRGSAPGRALRQAPPPDARCGRGDTGRSGGCRGKRRAAAGIPRAALRAVLRPCRAERAGLRGGALGPRAAAEVSAAGGRASGRAWAVARTRARPGRAAPWTATGVGGHDPCAPPRYSLLRRGKPRCHRPGAVSSADAAFGSSPVLASVGPQLLFGSHFHRVCAFPKCLNVSQIQNAVRWEIHNVGLLGNESDCLRDFALHLKIVSSGLHSLGIGIRPAKWRQGLTSWLEQILN